MRAVRDARAAFSEELDVIGVGPHAVREHRHRTERAKGVEVCDRRSAGALARACNVAAALGAMQMDPGVEPPGESGTFADRLVGARLEIV